MEKEIKKVGEKEIKKVGEKEIKIFTDGSYVKAIRACGYGVLFPNKEYSNISKPFTIEPKTNQRAELYAIYKGIKTVYKGIKTVYKGIKTVYKGNKNDEDGVNKVEVVGVDGIINRVNITIYTDSEYSIKSLTIWIKNWKKNNWKASTGKDVLNQDLIVKLDRLIEKYKTKYGSIKFIHVRSHTGRKDFESINNDLVDDLAKKGGKM
jgi:ribonuclease HI